MRPPSPRLANNGSGKDEVQFFSLDVTPGASQDSQGNWIRRPVAGTKYLAVVTPGFSVGVDSDGSQISVTTYQVMLYTNRAPFPIEDSPLEWFKDGVPQGTLVAMGEASPAAAGAFGFQAKQYGPNPDYASGMPEGVVTGP